MPKRKIKQFIPLIIFVVVIAAAVFSLVYKGKSIEIGSGNEFLSPSAANTPEIKKSPISGLSCENGDRRPVAVMLSGDAITRPLSGLARADLILEMPVITGGINRFMTIYVCGDPTEIGSVRSARDDFIPLAKGWDAIYAHWGGSHFALDELRSGVIDNLDALVNPFEAFYRKSGIAMPHNGFTSAARLLNASQKKGYRWESNLAAYPHLENFQPATTTAKTLIVAYPGAFQVKYQYDAASNSYLRWRGGTKETDKILKTQLAPKNVVIMRAPSRQIEGQYNDVQVEGQGAVAIYRNGEEIKGTWKKSASNQKDRLSFFDEKGREIEFVPGQIWIQVVEPREQITYE